MERVPLVKSENDGRPPVTARLLTAMDAINYGRQISPQLPAPQFDTHPIQARVVIEDGPVPFVGLHMVHLDMDAIAPTLCAWRAAGGTTYRKVWLLVRTADHDWVAKDCTHIHFIVDCGSFAPSVSD